MLVHRRRSRRAVSRREPKKPSSRTGAGQSGESNKGIVYHCFLYSPEWALTDRFMRIGARLGSSSPVAEAPADHSSCNGNNGESQR